MNITPDRYFLLAFLAVLGSKPEQHDSQIVASILFSITGLLSIMAALKLIRNSVKRSDKFHEIGVIVAAPLFWAGLYLLLRAVGFPFPFP